ncbi:MAG: B12-binding domain-containing radical SAM protein, partial [Promethearchaeota archaeon]
GFSPLIYDCPAQGINFKKFRTLLREKRPDFVVVNMALLTVKEDLLALRLAKHSGSTTVAFGYYGTIMAEKLLEEYPFIDLVIVHEPELSFLELLEGKQKNQIKGICYRSDDGTCVRNPRREFIENLDQLPKPCHNLVDLRRYVHPIDGEPFLSIQVSRGCPFRCKFCLAGLMNGYKFRTRTIESLIDEIKDVVKNLNVRKFFFRADTFTWNPRWVRNFCTRITKENLDIEWYANSRIDTLNLNDLKLIKASGCKLLTIGVETSDPRVQKLLGKNLKIDMIIKVLKKIHNAGIPVAINILMGTPFDTEATLMRNIAFCKRVQATFAVFTPFVNFPGIDLYNQQDESRIPPKVIRKYCRMGRLLFYARPKKILELAKLVITYIKPNFRFFKSTITNVIKYGMRILFG